LPERLSYAEAFERCAGFDPHRADLATLSRIDAPASATAAERADRDFWLNLWMGARVAPQLGHERPCFIHDFPASQAALARVHPGSPPLAQRFELLWKGIELANGFHELTDAREQERRFAAERAWRAANGREVPPFDRHLVDALAAGMPDCSGVALGVDRLLMLLLDVPDVARTLSFAAERA
jgi:lysyl-tRNA synthetase class 2